MLTPANVKKNNSTYFYCPISENNLPALICY